MTLFEVDGLKVKALAAVGAGPHLHEKDIEDLLWGTDEGRGLSLGDTR